jgi:DNA-binding transcriptional regulator PaaX
MKENAQRLLSWLYPPQQVSRWVSVNELPLVAPDLTTGGLQSTLNYLAARRRLVLERVDGQQSASITTHGMRALESAIPAFLPTRRQWKGNWQAVLFLQSPKHDQHFRFLRRILLGAHAISIARGMFLYPGELPERVSFELQNSYEGSVAVVAFKEWTFGDEKEIIGSHLKLSDQIAAYSSISKEIDSLLVKETPLISFTDQHKLRFSSIFDRLFATLHQDFGIHHAYFPQVESGVDLLFKLQNLSAMG